MVDRLVTADRLVYAKGSEVLWPLLNRASGAALAAETDAKRSEAGAQSAVATGRYFPSRAAGEAGSTANQLFSTDDGAGSLIYYRRTAGGSTEIGRAVTPARIASANGASLIGYKRPEAPAVLRLLSSRNDEIIYAKDYSSAPNVGNAPNDFTQNAIDMARAAPYGAVFEFSHGLRESGGEFTFSEPWTITKSQSIRGKPGSTRLRGMMTAANSDIVRFVPDTESRRAFIEGVEIAHYGVAGRHAVFVGNDDVGILGLTIRDAALAAGPNPDGRGVRFEGVGTHWNQVVNCDVFEGGIEVAGADGTKIIECRIAGVRCGVRFLTVPGAYKSGVYGGTIGSRDGGVFLGEIQQADILNGQCEQGFDGGRPSQVNAFTLPNGEPASAHIILYGGEELCRDVRIIGNNLGSGSNQTQAIIGSGYARDVFVDENVFANLGTSGYDMVLTGNSNFDWRIGNRNRVYGLTRAGLPSRATPNSLDPSELLLVNDNAAGTYGFAARKMAVQVAVRNGWSSNGGSFRVWKGEDNVLRFCGSLAPGTLTAGTEVFTLPLGMRPRHTTALRAVSFATGQTVSLAVAADTGIAKLIADCPSGALCFDDATMSIKGQFGYLSGPI